VAPSVAEELARRTDGNPLAVLELVGDLSAAQRAGSEALAPETSVPEVVRDAFLRRLGDVDVVSWTLLLHVAADPEMTVEQLRRAAGSLPDGRRVKDDLFARGLVRTNGDHVSFDHPLMRVAVYQHATDDERRRVHRSLAALLEHEGELSRAAWHRSLAAEGPDEHVAAALELAAERARATGDALAAGEAFDRAAHLSTTEPEAVRRLLAAAALFQAGGDGARAVGAWDAALARTDDPGLRADVHFLRTVQAINVIGVTIQPDELIVVAEQLVAHDSARAGRVLAVTAYAAPIAGLPMVRAVEIGNRAVTLLGPHDPAAAFAMLIAEIGRVAIGELNRAPSLRELAEKLGPALLTPETIGIADSFANAFAWLDDFSSASRLTSGRVRAARELASLPMLAFALSSRSDLYFRTGHFEAARADAIESVGLASDSGQQVMATLPLIARTRVDAALGFDADAVASGEDALALASDHGVASMQWWAHGALGFAHLSAGRLAEAIRHLEWADRYTSERDWRCLTIMPALPDLIEAYVAAGRHGDAEQLLVRVVEGRVGEQTRSAAALVERCRGLVTDDIDEPFARARELHSELPTPFERARTELCWGERLRDAHRSNGAREHLEAAAATFEALGARPWLRRADPDGRRVGATPAAELSPREFQVAVVVGQGATNQEAASALFVSTRTVESHLASIYRKLGIRSRSELARRVASDDRFRGTAAEAAGEGLSGSAARAG
jgi:DNA-binding CsgD family transcriptional regulator